MMGIGPIWGIYSLTFILSWFYLLFKGLIPSGLDVFPRGPPALADHYYPVKALFSFGNNNNNNNNNLYLSLNRSSRTRVLY